jgi:hypothetical protein
MSGGAIAFMALSWTFVLGLTGYCFYLLLTEQKHFDPDGTGPASPPEPPHAKKK